MNLRVCKHLRTKKMFIPAQAEEAFAPPGQEAAHDSHCWCNCTLTEAGPDDRPVALHMCHDARPCFEE